MFAGIKKAMAEAREEKAAEVAAEKAALDRVLNHQSGSEIWEYCALTFVRTSEMDAGLLYLTYIGASGESKMHLYGKSPSGEETAQIEAMAGLGRAGWEACGGTRNMKFFEEYNKKTKETDITSLQAEELYFKRRLLSTNPPEA